MMHGVYEEIRKIGGNGLELHAKIINQMAVKWFQDVSIP